MRILHINKYNHERDGVGRYMHDVMRLADAHGHVTAVLAMHHPENNSSPWEHFFVRNLDTSSAGKGLHAVRQSLRTWWSREAYQKTRAIISAFKPDVIHAHNLYTHLSPSVLSAAQDEGIPVVLTAHDYGYISANYGLFDGSAPLAPTVSWLRVVQTKCIKQSYLATAVADAIVRIQKRLGMWTRGVARICVASHVVKNAMVQGGYEESCIQHIPLPSGTCDMSVGVENLPPLPHPTRSRRIIFAGRFEAYKGIDVVMELATRMPDVAFVCIGHGSQEESLRAYAVKHKNLLVLSILPPHELWKMMEDSAGVIVPSLWPEPFGLVALESLALGTPAIVSNEGALSEIVEHGVSGFVEDPHDLDAWERDIRKLLSASPAVQRMRQAAAERGRSMGDPELHWGRLQGVYTQAIQEKENR